MIGAPSLGFESRFLDFVDRIKKKGIDTTYIFNLKKLKSRLTEICDISERNGCSTIMAAKSFNDPFIYRLCNQYLSGFDVSNSLEYSSVSSLCEGKIISVTGPYAHSLNLDTPNNMGLLCLNASNQNQLELFLKYSGYYKIGLRMAIDDNSRFGFSLNNEIFKKASFPFNKISGIHIHSGFGQNFYSSYVENAKKLLEFSNRYNITLKYINLGGGLHNLDLESFNSLLKKLRRIIRRDITLIFEPGDFLFHRTGFLLSKIIEVPQWNTYTNPINITLACSKDCHLKWSNPFLIPGFPNSGKKRLLNIFGATCYEKDFIGSYPIKISNRAPFSLNEYILFGGVTGYSYSWNNSFNGIGASQAVFYE